MESSTRNLMILYAIVAFLSIAGVALNIIQVYNLKALEDPKLTEEIVQGMTKGFYVIAFIYFLVALTSLTAIVKGKLSKPFLIFLAVLLVSIFVFGPFIFDFILGDEILNKLK